MFYIFPLVGLKRTLFTNFFQRLERALYQFWDFGGKSLLSGEGGPPYPNSPVAEGGDGLNPKPLKPKP